MTDAPSIRPTGDLTALNQAYENSMGRVISGDATQRGGIDFAPDQVASFVALCRKHGVPEEKIRAAVEGDGFSMPGEIKPGPDNRTEDQREFDATALALNADPAAYRTSFFALKSAPQTAALAQAIGGSDVTFAPALDKAMRDGMAAMNMPAQAGGSIIDMAAETAARFSRLPDAEKSAARKQANAQVTAALGADATKDMRALLSLWQAKAPEVVNALIEGDYLSDARVLGQLVMQARRMLTRDELGKRK